MTPRGRLANRIGAIAAGLWAVVALQGSPALASVSAAEFSDVSPRAFSAIWLSDEPVEAATVRVFSEPGGTTDLTADLSVKLVSESFPPALNLGIVKVDVSGLAPDTCVFVQTETVTATGTIQEPVSAPLPQVCTFREVSKADHTGTPVSNDLIRHDILEPDGITPAPGTLLLVSVPGVADVPVSAFVGESLASPAAVVDLNNIFDPVTGASARVLSGDVLVVEEVRGLLCSDLQSERLVRHRLAPPHQEVAAIGIEIPEVEVPDTCFPADVDCSGEVDEADAQRVANHFNASQGECGFNPDLDVVPDGVINVFDWSFVSSHIGAGAP